MVAKIEHSSCFAKMLVSFWNSFGPFGEQNCSLVFTVLNPSIFIARVLYHICYVRGLTTLEKYDDTRK